jgi:hypothetical protein
MSFRRLQIGASAELDLSIPSMVLISQGFVLMNSVLEMLSLGLVCVLFIVFFSDRR